MDSSVAAFNKEDLLLVLREVEYIMLSLRDIGTRYFGVQARAT
ncbi:hypothetical protein [Leifsonia aquatica]